MFNIQSRKEVFLYVILPTDGRGSGVSKVIHSFFCLSFESILEESLGVSKLKQLFRKSVKMEYEEGYLVSNECRVRNHLGVAPLL